MVVMMDSRLFLRDEELDQGVELILAAQRHLRAAADDVRREARLSESELELLLAMRAKPGQTVGALRSHLFMAVPTFARLLGQLDKRNLIHKQRGSSDSRQRQLYLSDAGEAMMSPITEALGSRLRQAYKAAGAENVAGTRATLDAVSGERDG